MRVAETPKCRWVSVVDGQGRRRMEMRWGQAGAVAVLTPRTGYGTASRAA